MKRTFFVTGLILGLASSAQAQCSSGSCQVPQPAPPTAVYVTVRVSPQPVVFVHYQAAPKPWICRLFPRLKRCQ
jgi:hypothetical protein